MIFPLLVLKFSTFLVSWVASNEHFTGLEEFEKGRSFIPGVTAFSIMLVIVILVRIWIKKEEE